jgi:hypothetical protein
LTLAAGAGLVAGSDASRARLPLTLVQVEELCRQRPRFAVAERCREADA